MSSAELLQGQSEPSSKQSHRAEQVTSEHQVTAGVPSSRSPPSMSSTLLAPPPPLPLPGSAKAPSFDSTQPQTLRRFFDDLEFVYERSQVVDADRKRYVGRYIPYDVEELWTSLPEWSPTSTASFTELRAAVGALYPEVRPDRKFAYRHLEELVEEWHSHEFSSLEDYGRFYRAFFRISSYLRKKDELGAAEEGRLFKQVFPADSRFRRRLSHRLRLKFPDRHLTDVFTLSELHAAAVYVLEGVEAHAFPPSVRARQCYPTPSPVVALFEPPGPVLTPPRLPSPTVKPIEPPVFAAHPPVAAQTVTAQSNPAAAVAVQSLEVLPILSVEEPSVEKPVDSCHYCGAVKCYIRSCPAVVADISSGQCTRNSDGQVILPSGRFVPRGLPGRTMRERVLEWHRRHPNASSDSPIAKADSPPVDTSRLVLDPSAVTSRSASRVFQAPWTRSRSKMSPGPLRSSQRAQNTAEHVSLEAADDSLPNPAPEWKIRSWSDRVPDFVDKSQSSPQVSPEHLVLPAVDREQDDPYASPSTHTALSSAESDHSLPDESWRAPCEAPEVIERVAQRILSIPVRLSVQELEACGAWEDIETSAAARIGEVKSPIEAQQSRNQPLATGHSTTVSLFPFRRVTPLLNSFAYIVGLEGSLVIG